jgi:hypothetical protein
MLSKDKDPATCKPEKYGFNIWTKNEPKPYIDSFAIFAAQHSTEIEAIVDDLLPAVIFSRTQRKNAEMSQRYVDYMQRAGFDRITLVSELLPERDKDLERIYKASGKLALSTFVSLLPETKRLNQDEIGLNEIIDPCWQLEVLESGIVKCGITKYLTGKRSLALFRFAKETIVNFDYIVIDKDQK